MSLKVKSVRRRELLDRAAIAVENAFRAADTIAPVAVAQRLLDEHAETSLTVVELADLIARLAEGRGVRQAP